MEELHLGSSTPPENFSGGRNLNIEILRIISMLMIIIGHTLGHSHVINEADGLMYILTNAVYILILPAVNVYVLISGYFSVNTKWNIKRIVSLWLQVFFFSFVSYVIALATGITQFSFLEAVKVLLPISGNQYWFARVFWCFSLFAPFEAILLKALTKKQFQFLLGITIAIFSLWRSFIPFSTTVNSEGGNSIMWFFVLFAFAAYFRLHGNSERKSGFWAIVFVISSVLTIASFFALSFISNRLGFEGRGTSLFTEYTSITMLCMSLSLFMIFVRFPENKYSNRVRKIIMFFSGSTFSVYLIHENIYVKQWLWSTFNPIEWMNTGYFWIRLVLIVIGIFLICSIIDSLSWKPISKLIKKTDFRFLQDKISDLNK